MGWVVPNEGKQTYIWLSKTQANWSFHTTGKIKSTNNIKNTILYCPIKFIGGNNEIIK